MSDINYQPPPTSSSGDADLLIDDLSYQTAKEYVMRFLVAEKKTATALREKQQAFEKWNERLAYAEKQGTPEQVQKAKQELHFLISERDKLKTELEELQRKNVVLREKLQAKANQSGIPKSAFAEQLLADFEQLVDVDEYKLDQAVKEQAAKDELAKLKAKLNLD